MANKKEMKSNAQNNAHKHAWVFGQQHKDVSKDSQKAGATVKKEHHHSVQHYHGTNPILRLYDTQYKKLLVIPIILFIVAISIIGFKFATTGEFIDRGVTLKGGLILDIYMQIPVSNEVLKKDIETNFIKSSAEVTTLKNLDGTYLATTIYASDVKGEELLDFISQKYSLSFQGKDNYQINEVETSFSSMFFRQLIWAVVIAFVFMGIVVFIIYKSPVPSLAVIIAVVADVIETIAVLNLLGISISSAAIAAFIMLIGYSVDTDILLSTKVLRQRHGNIFDSIIDSAKTGLMMVGTALIVALSCFFFTNSTVLKEIMLVIIIGCIFDIINTWITNAALLRMYVERKK
jgi:preprotein translocase subunit SecF